MAELARWLAEAGVTLVGMEGTGVYWKTVLQALEDRCECWLINAHHFIEGDSATLVALRVCAATRSPPKIHEDRDYLSTGV